MGATFYKGGNLSITSKDLIPLEELGARLMELAEEACQGREKIITRNGQAYLALIDARRLVDYHRPERDNIHLALLDGAARGWDAVESGDLMSVAELKAQYDH
jgi:hypothetical protein